jgi:hypothetical protein
MIHPAATGGSGWFWPLTIDCTAVRTVAMARVAMKEFTRSTTTTKPFTTPTSAAAATVMATACHIPHLWLVWSETTRMVAKLASEPTDRSYAPAVSGTSTASPSMATMACDAATE